MKKNNKLVFAVILAAAILTACAPKTAATVTETAVPQPAVLIAEGRLMPVKALDQSFTFSGQVVEVLVKNGDTVTLGQPLARLSDSPDAQLALSRAKLDQLAAQQALDTLKANAALVLANAELTAIDASKSLDNAQSRYNNSNSNENLLMLDVAKAQKKLADDSLVKLKANNGMDPDILASAQARLEAANSAVSSARSAINSLELKASLAGTVADLSIQPGQRVTAYFPVMAVADFSQWFVKTDNLKETEVINVKVGQKVNIVLDAIPDKTLKGEVTDINQRYEEKRGDITYIVTISLLSTDPLMRWGMTASVEFLP